jgi:medium-chain acyl-[acyl-carrier-protein] hydrolase
MKLGRNKWTIIPETRPDAAVRLLCFHHACGGAYAFRSWPRMLRPEVELVAVQLPGRENRFSEPLLFSAEAVLEALIRSLDDSLGSRYAIFGHSLGALLAYLLVCRVRRTAELPMPIRLFLSSATIPRQPSCDGTSQTARPPLSDEALIDKITTLGGTPAGILSDRALLDLFLPVLRADFSILAQASAAARQVLDVPFTILGGSDDPTVHPTDLEAWRGLSSQTCKTHILEGDHFYLRSSQAALLEIINGALEAHIGYPSRATK